MNIEITSTVTAAQIVKAIETHGEATINEGFGGTYGLTITATETGYNVTDETGGDQDAATLAEAGTIAADFIENLDADAEWDEAVAALRSI